MERKYPPIAQICVLVLVSMVIGGVLLAANAVLLSRIPDFAWASFFKVFRWTILAEGIVAGVLEFVFIFDGTRGAVLVLMSSTLVIFVLDLAVLFGFSVAQFQEESGIST